MLAAIIHWGGINNNEELYFDTDTYNVAIVKPLTDDLRSRILRRKRKRARAAFEPFARLVWYVLRAMPVIFPFGPIIYY